MENQICFSQAVFTQSSCLWKCQEDSNRPKYITHYFYFVWKETIHTPLKVATAKVLLSIVYVIDETCFNEWFLVHVITVRSYFSQKFIVTLRFFNCHIIALFAASVLKEIRNSCVIHSITIKFEYQDSKIKLIMLLKFL